MNAEFAQSVTIVADQERIASVKAQMVDFLKTVHDPEIPLNIYDLGLIYRIDLLPEGETYRAEIDMTLTSPGCPVAGTMPGLVQLAASQTEGVSDVQVNLVWDPPWDRAKMSDEAKLELNLF
jgi:FeS assembly SUF system protein